MAPPRKKKKSKFSKDKSDKSSFEVSNPGGRYGLRSRQNSEGTSDAHSATAENSKKNPTAADCNQKGDVDISPSSNMNPTPSSTLTKGLTIFSAAVTKRKPPASLILAKKRRKPTNSSISDIGSGVSLHPEDASSTSSTPLSSLPSSYTDEDFEDGPIKESTYELRFSSAKIRYPTRKGMVTNYNDKLKINIKQGLPIIKDKIPDLQHIVAEQNERLVKRGHLKFKIVDYKDRSEKFMNYFSYKLNGGTIDSCALQMRFDEFFRISEGLFYVSHRSYEESLELIDVFENMAMWEMSENYAYFFDKKNPKLSTRHMFNVLDSLPLNIHRNGRGLLLPQMNIDNDVRICKDDERINIQEGSLPNPLRDVHVDSVGDVKRVVGVTIPKSNFGFPGSLSASRISDGPSLDEVNVIVAGAPRTWVFVPAIHFEQVRDLVLKEIHGLGLESDDHLLTNKKECILQHQCLLMTPSFFKRHGIKHEVVMQNDGELMVIGAKVISSSLSSGMVVSKSFCAAFSDFGVKFNYGQTQCDCALDVTADQPSQSTLTRTNDGSAETSIPSNVGESENESDSSSEYESVDFTDDQSSISSEDSSSSPKRFTLRTWKVNRLLKMTDNVLHGKLHTVRIVGGKRRKYRSQKKERRYPCPRCKRIFVSQDALDGHLDDIPNKCNKYGKCPVEGCTVKPSSIDSRVKFEQHMRAHRNPDWRTENIVKALESRRKSKAKPSPTPTDDLEIAKVKVKKTRTKKKKEPIVFDSDDDSPNETQGDVSDESQSSESKVPTRRKKPIQLEAKSRPNVKALVLPILKRNKTISAMQTLESEKVECVKVGISKGKRHVAAEEMDEEAPEPTVVLSSLTSQVEIAFQEKIPEIDDAGDESQKENEVVASDVSDTCQSKDPVQRTPTPPNAETLVETKISSKDNSSSDDNFEIIGEPPEILDQSPSEPVSKLTVNPLPVAQDSLVEQIDGVVGGANMDNDSVIPSDSELKQPSGTPGETLSSPKSTTAAFESGQVNVTDSARSDAKKEDETDDLLDLPKAVAVIEKSPSKLSPTPLRGILHAATMENSKKGSDTPSSPNRDSALSASRDKKNEGTGNTSKDSLSLKYYIPPSIHPSAEEIVKRSFGLSEFVQTEVEITSAAPLSVPGTSVPTPDNIDDPIQKCTAAESITVVESVKVTTTTSD